MPSIDAQPESKPAHRSRKSQSASTTTSSVELKGSMFTITVLCLRSFDVKSITAELKKRIEQAPRFFKNAPVILDLKDLNSLNKAFNFDQLLDALRNTCHLVPVGVRHASPDQNNAALQAGLAIMQGGGGGERETTGESAGDEKQAAQGEPAPKVTATQTGSATLVTHPIRSGQQIYARGGDLIVTAAVNHGAEILADGNIHVYAPLRGRALAGVQGDEQARIFCHSLEAELISIAGHYRVFEDNVPEQYKINPVQVYLQDDRLVINPIH